MNRIGMKYAVSASIPAERTPTPRKIAALALAFSFLALVFVPNGYGVVNTLDCSGPSNTLDHYDKVLEAQKNNLADPVVRYDLGFTAICIGREAEGLEHLRRASEGEHVAATKVLGSYYDKNRSFDTSQRASLENAYKAIAYYEKAADQIENASNYPRGVSEDMPALEYVSMTSYRVFTRLPALHFNIYSKLLGDTMNNGTLHSGTLEILQQMGDTATRCLRRPALVVWKEKKERVYRTQQIECRAYLDFVEAIYPLEDERIQIAKSCTVRVNQCQQHKDKISQMGKIANKLFIDLKKSPGSSVVSERDRG